MPSGPSRGVPSSGPPACSNRSSGLSYLLGACGRRSLILLGACAALLIIRFSGSGGCRPPPPVATPLASSLRAPSRGAPPLKASWHRRARRWIRAARSRLRAGPPYERLERSAVQARAAAPPSERVRALPAELLRRPRGALATTNRHLRQREAPIARQARGGHER